MKNFKIIALILILALSFSVLVSCDALDEIMGNVNGGATDETPDDGQGDDNSDDSNKTPECEHLWENNTCTKCGEVCAEHVWHEGHCTICNYTCNHKESGYENSVCQNCGYICVHIGYINFVDTCMECDTALENLILVQHLASNDSDYVVARDCTLAEYIEKCLGTTYEETTKNGYRWFALHNVTYFTELTPDTVLYDFDPSTQIIQLYIFETDPETCPHPWNPSTHPGVCPICKLVCEHQFNPQNGYYCDICHVQGQSTECDHSWYLGYCTKCYQGCKHYCGYDNVCDICGMRLDGVAITILHGDFYYLVDFYSTLEEFISEHLGTTYEETVADGGYWMAYDVYGDEVILAADRLLCSIGTNYELLLIPGNECKHVWLDGKCNLCDKVCEHYFVPGNEDTCFICGMQAIVPPSCFHVWVDGVCDLCGTVCDHGLATDIVCPICGEWVSGSYILLTYNNSEYKVRYESTLAEFVSEHLGTTYEATVANGSYWMALDPFNFDKINLEANTPLNMFGACFELYYIDCTPPPACEHEWVDGFCTKCFRDCHHSYSDSVCTVCGKVCENHYFSSGSCIYCGLPCEHVWNSDYRCEKCDFPCFHEGIAEHGYCTVCGYECLHQWNHTQCESCGYVCIHTFDGPSCTKCGYMSGGIDNPLTIYFEDTVYTTPYSASFQELFYLYSDFNYRLGFSDYEESLQYGYWVVVTDSGDVRIGEYTSLCEFGHEMTIAFRADDAEECHHLYWNEGYCASCGIPCEHGAFLDGMCGICGMPCVHSWVDGQCLICFKECEHPYWNDGRCTQCDMEKGGVPEGSVVFTLMLQDAPGSDIIHTFELYIDYEMSIMDMFHYPVRNLDGEILYIPFEYNYLVRYNGTALSDEELYDVYVTNGSQIFVYQCYIFDLESVVDGETTYNEYKTPYKLTGYDLLHIMNMAGTGDYQVTVNGFNYDTMTFENELLPLDSSRCHVRVESLVMTSGPVRLEVLHDGNYQYSFEADGELRVSDFFSMSDDFNDFLYTIEYPDGTVMPLYDFDLLLPFNPDYVDYNYGATVYRIDMKFNVFFVNLVIDNQDYGSQKFYKTDNITVRDILFSFGFYDDTENYEWMINLPGSGYSDLDMVINEDAYIYAYDSRPYIELNVDGVSYKYNHNETLTLAQAIEIINSIHGTSLTFEGYIWYGYSNDHWRDVQITDPDFIVVESSYSRTVTAKSHNTVNVYFTTDLAPLTEDGMMEGILFTKGGEWYTPEIPSFILEMTRGYITFTGEFEYRVYDTKSWEIIERRDINSIEELLALNLTEVTLYAKYEVNYEIFCGTYVKSDEIVIITENGISSYYRWSDTWNEERSYHIECSAYMITLRGDGFGYSADYLMYEYSRIEDGAFCALVRHEAGYVEMYLSYDEYLMILENYQVNRITDKDGYELAEVGASGLYYLEVSEKPYYEY